MPYIFFDYAGEEPPRGLHLISVSGKEAISELFNYTLELEADKDLEIDPTAIIGQEISLRVDYFVQQDSRSNEDPAFIHGIVNCIKKKNINSKTGLRGYIVELVPALWFLTKKSSFQVFENKKSSEIIISVFNDSKIKAPIPSGKIKREHCLQYMETDYEFVSRLMADEGFIFYFEHSKNEHKLIVKDSNKYLNVGKLNFLRDIKSWSSEYKFISSKWDVGDYGYSDKAKSLAENKKSIIKGLNNDKHTRVLSNANLAGDGDKNALERQAVILAGQEDAGYEMIEVSSDFSGICAGASFMVDGEEYLPKGSDSEFVVIEALHQLDSGSRYGNSFKCIPARLAYWGKKRESRPVANGPMTAKVVKSGGDDLGRVKVKFLYEGADSEKTDSCWIRVAQVIGGTSYGAMFTPRIGEEVVVTFINGNPDRPLITGTLYNDANKPPKDYIGETDKPTRNGFLTSFDGKKFNELYFEDKPGEELFYVRTDNNYERLVEANDTLTITKGERKILIKEGNENETLNKGNKTTTLIEGNQTIALNKGDRKVTVKKGEIKVESSDKNIQMKAGKSLEVNVGKNVELKASSNVELDASSTIKLSANSKIELKVGGSSMTIDSMGISLKVGGNSVKIEQSGVTVKGIMVKVEGSVQAELKAPMATVSGDGMLTVKGGVVMIN